MGRWLREWFMKCRAQITEGPRCRWLDASEEPRLVQLAPLNPKVHSAIGILATGDRIRVLGLRARPDGSLVPTQRTVLARVEDLPILTPRTAAIRGPEEPRRSLDEQRQSSIKPGPWDLGLPVTQMAVPRRVV